MMRKTRSLSELYAEDPEAADRKLWGRQADPTTRRGFLKGGGLATLATVLGASIPMAEFLPAGILPVALAQEPETAAGELPLLAGKEAELHVLNDLPLCAETPAHLLDDRTTPTSRLFVRNNGASPERVDPASWTLEVAGESVPEPHTFSLAELRSQFDVVTLDLQLECGGNGRAEFYPPASGNQWTTGAVGCPAWTGVRLADVLRRVGLADSAVYVGYYGADRHLSGDASHVVISRGVPIAKALQEETLLAFELNGEPMPLLHGGPLRLVCGGWPGSASGKWLQRLVVRDRVHDGPKMTGQSYRMPCSPVAPGTHVPDSEMCIIESMPVRSLITRPRSGLVHSSSLPLEVAGHAWAGERQVAAVELSLDFGRSWQPTRLEPPVNRLAWQRFVAQVQFPTLGYYEVWARATDAAGVPQPMVVPGWNPRGYLNNACHRVAVRVT